ncbi:hypothetical protein [Kitasatospora sp. NPDC056531]|uniref:hypothetical protein n=1 Tax=Kitasatospora sp. NPDC056531 TaxID=3345856 RepID=UPI00369BA993
MPGTGGEVPGAVNCLDVPHPKDPEAYGRSNACVTDAVDGYLVDLKPVPTGAACCPPAPCHRQPPR